LEVERVRRIAELLVELRKELARSSPLGSSGYGESDIERQLRQLIRRIEKEYRIGIVL